MVDRMNVQAYERKIGVGKIFEDLQIKARL
jgi:hypothetical protein